MFTLPYIHFEISTRRLPESAIRIYPIVCMHLGSPQCDVQFIRDHIKRIEDDPCARWVYLGDGGECVTKYSKGDVYGQLLNPQQQMEMVLDLLAPIKGKGLFGVRGNHGKRIYRESGLDFDHNLVTRLGLPYLGISAFVNMVINRSSYDMYFHHGLDSGVALRAKIAKAESFSQFIDCDAIFTAHSHIAVDLPPCKLLSPDNAARKVNVKMRHQYICGSAYDSRTGYAEDKGYPPLMPEWIVVEFDGRIQQGFPVKMQSSRVFRSDGRHELRHDYLAKYLEDNIHG